MSCNVCIETYNKSSRKRIECAKCQFDSCSSCYKTYLINSKSDPCCMSCNQKWDMQYLSQSLPMTFINSTLKKHRETLLFERELSLLPSTQPAVKRMLKIRKYNGKLVELKNNQRAKNIELHTEGNNRTFQETLDIYMELRTIKESMRELKTKLRNILNSKPEEKTKLYVRNCPVEDCRGFVDNTWNCGLCSVHVCRKCHEIKQKDTDHECKEENIETAKLLAKDSKPCPGCAVLIFRISGCNQMWCVNCGVTFDWQTLKIDQGHIHNPEYFKALQSGRVPFAERNNNNADVCGRNLPADYLIISHVNGSEMNFADKEYMIEVYRHMRHLTFVTRPYYANRIMDNNEHLRVRYMLKDITDDQFKKQLQQQEKSTRKNQDILNVLDMVIEMSVGLFHDMLQSDVLVAMETKMKEMQELLQYGEDCMIRIGKMYKGQTPFINLI